ncbi:hypothetical protein BaRGS_00031048 [Batillaria attramentaria]|uniref:Uncharacterized protein n=1 Tax=Batillaria attramentaria TaxID=370345 RepID=A0ABD0JRP1_9CAEN
MPLNQGLEEQFIQQNLSVWKRKKSKHKGSRIQRSDMGHIKQIWSQLIHYFMLCLVEGKMLTTEYSVKFTVNSCRVPSQKAGRSRAYRKTDWLVFHLV